MNIFRRAISIVLTFILIVSILCVIPSASAASTNANSTLKITATCLYDEAFEVLDQINSLRKSKGLSAYKMTSAFMKNAMQRAAEITVLFEHDRPDGSSCFTINDALNSENIGIAYLDAKEVVSGWKNSTAHAENMFNSSYKTVGIGAVQHNGARYWVMLFSKNSGTATTSVPDNVDKTFSISLGKTTYNVAMDIPSKICLTDQQSVRLVGDNKSYSLQFVVNTGDFTWSSSNPDVISVSGNNIHALSEGTATITAKGSCVTVSKKITVVEYGKGKSHIAGDNITWEYNNQTLIFSGSGAMSSFTTKYDDNGFISTDSPWFDNVNRVRSVVVNEGITSIGNCAFACFSSLSDVSLPTSLTSIGDSVFACCPSLVNITIPSQVTTIGRKCFYICSALNSVTLPEKLESFADKTFFLCGELRSISIPSGVKKIGGFSFVNCYNLSSVLLPENLEVIDEYAFYCCKSLKSITIPYKVSTLGAMAFNGCKVLAKVTVENPEIEFATTDIFTGCKSTLTFYAYKKSTTQAYANENGFKFVEVEKPADYNLLGDVDRDGYVSIFDATAIQRHLASIALFNEEQLAFADYLEDGVIDLMDATQIQLKLAHLI